MPDPMGPCFAGGFQDFAVDEGGNRHVLSYLPDKNNGDLQLAGLPPQYYWVPNGVRIARKGEAGDYKFSLLHFVGVRGKDTHVGSTVDEEDFAGGVLALTTTMAPPASVLQKSQEQLLERFRGDSERYWGWRTPATPRFAPIPIMKNITALSNLRPEQSGATPDPVPADEGGGAPDGGGGDGGSPDDGGSGDGGDPERSLFPRRGLRRNRHPRANLMPRTVAVRDGQTLHRVARGGNLDPWAWQLQGNGGGSMTALGENAYSGLIGSIPTAILWQAFHGVYSPIFVVNALKLKLWSQTIRLVIDGDWQSIYTHFSTQARGGYAWFSGDVQAEMNRMMYEGKGLSIKLQIDGTVPGADEMKKEAQKRMAQITDKFMALAQKVIFDPPKPTTPPAQASGGGGFLGLSYGLGVALKAKFEQTGLKLHYEDVIDEQYLHDHVISSSLEGFFNEIKANPENEDKYFTTIELSDWERKVHRVVKPIANWLDRSQGWAGDPVQFLGVQFGYPGRDGRVQWKGAQFNASNGDETAQWTYNESMKSVRDVVNPPKGWQPDMTLVKRSVHMAEPPSLTAFPYTRIFVEEKVVDIDGKAGQWMDDVLIEVRADSVGALDLELSLSAVLENSRQVVELTVQPNGTTLKGRKRAPVKFLFTYKDQYEPRYLRVFTGDVNYVPDYQYQVRVIIKGTLSAKGKEWKGPWVAGNTNGPLVVSVPSEEEALPGTRKFISPMRRPKWPEETPVTHEAEEPVAAGGGGGEPGAPPRTVRRTAAGASSRAPSRVHGFTYEPPRTTRTASARGMTRRGAAGEDTDVLDDDTEALDESSTDDSYMDQPGYYAEDEESGETTAEGGAPAGDEELPEEDAANAPAGDGEDEESFEGMKGGPPPAEDESAEQPDDEEGAVAAVASGEEEGDLSDDASPDWDADDAEAEHPAEQPVAQSAPPSGATKGASKYAKSATRVASRAAPASKARHARTTPAAGGGNGDDGGEGWHIRRHHPF